MAQVELAFWGAALFVAYTYVGYPAAVWALSRFRREAQVDLSTIDDWPELTIVVAVHNERDRVARKIENLRAVRYPSGKMRILFVSDGSTDGTANEIARFSDVRLHAYDQRRGKPYALNRALERVDTPIVVFTDVRQELEPDAIYRLVARLRDPSVGAVSGELVHRDPTTHAAAHIGLYWRYEKWIRKSESRLASTVGVTGALYAIRRCDWRPLAENALLDDFEVPMQIVRRGHRVLFESGAHVYDELQQDTPGERKRKVRTLTGNFQVFARMPWLFLPWRNPLWIQFVSHKVFRLAVPYALLVAAAASMLGEGPWMRGAAAAQVLFYAASAGGLLIPRLRRQRLVSFAVVFVELNWAAVLAFRNFLLQRIDPRWEKT